jgi:hypothetical protein
MKEPWFATVLQRALGAGLAGAALVDRDGNTVATAGEIAEEEAMPLVALVMYRLNSDDLAERMFAGEIVSLDLDGREVAVGVAKRQLFVVAVLAAATPIARARLPELRARVEGLLQDPGEDTLPARWPGAGTSGSGPAELPLGITARAKA